MGTHYYFDKFWSFVHVEMWLYDAFIHNKYYYIAHTATAGATIDVPGHT